MRAFPNPSLTGITSKGHMRIAVVHSYYKSDQPSGENLVVDAQVDALARAGHDVHVIDARTDDRSGERGYQLRAAMRVATGRGESPQEQLASVRPDVIHVHNTFPNWATDWLNTWGHKTVATMHNYRSVCAAGTLFRDGKPCHDCLATPVLPAIRHSCYHDRKLGTVPVALATRPGGSLNKIPRQAARVVALNSSMQEQLSSVFSRPIDLVPNFVSIDPSAANIH